MDLDNPFAMCQNRQIITTPGHTISRISLFKKKKLKKSLVKIFLQFRWLTNTDDVEFYAVLSSLWITPTASRELLQSQIWTLTTLTDGRRKFCFPPMATTCCVPGHIIGGFTWCYWILTKTMCQATLQDKLIILTNMDPVKCEHQTGSHGIPLEGNLKKLHVSPPA